MKRLKVMRKAFRYPSLTWGAMLALSCLMMTIGHWLAIPYLTGTSVGWLMTGWIAVILIVVFAGVDAYRSERIRKRREENEKN